VLRLALKVSCKFPEMDTFYKPDDFSRPASITTIALLHLKLKFNINYIELYSHGVKHLTILYLRFTKNHRTQLLFELSMDCSKSYDLLLLTFVRKISIGQTLIILYGL